MAKLTEKSLAVFNHIKGLGGADATAADIAEAMGLEVKSVNGVVTGLQKRGLTVRTPVEVEVAGEEGKTSHKTVKFITLTDAGLAYDPEAAE